MTSREEMDLEAAWLNNEHKRLFGVLPGGTGIGLGSNMIDVHTAQSRIFRHYIEEMKRVLGHDDRSASE